MQVIVESPEFLADAKAAGLEEADLERIVTRIARDPAGGVVIPGTGGARKLRFAGRGKGKSGGYRVITFYSGPHLPVFLLTVFGKGERADLSRAERNALRRELAEMVELYRKGVTHHVRSR